jgi:cholesterol oxidase
MNYLPDAFNHGAQIFTSAKVDHVARDGQLWKVLVEDMGGRAAADAKTPPVLREIVADIVVLAAGTLGSTEIMLRSRERGLETRACSRGFSGNGDAGLRLRLRSGQRRCKTPAHLGTGSGNIWPQQPARRPCVPTLHRGHRHAGNGPGRVRARDRGQMLPSGLAAACPPVFLFAEALSADQRGLPTGDRLKDAQALAKGVRDPQQLSDLAYTGPVSAQTFLLASHETDALGGRRSTATG